MTYEEFSYAFRKGYITQIRFFIRNYSHYHNCSIQAYYETVLYNGEQTRIRMIHCRLREDHRERYNFAFSLNGSFTLFKIKGIYYSLKEVWDQIELTYVLYS